MIQVCNINLWLKEQSTVCVYQGALVIRVPELSRHTVISTVHTALHSWDKTLHFINKSSPPNSWGPCFDRYPSALRRDMRLQLCSPRRKSSTLKAYRGRATCSVSRQTPHPQPSGESLVYYRGLKSRLVKPICGVEAVCDNLKTTRWGGQSVHVCSRLLAVLLRI